MGVRYLNLQTRGKPDRGWGLGLAQQLEEVLEEHMVPAAEHQGVSIEHINCLKLPSSGR